MSFYFWAMLPLKIGSLSALLEKVVRRLPDPVQLCCLFFGRQKKTMKFCPIGLSSLAIGRWGSLSRARLIAAAANAMGIHPCVPPPPSITPNPTLTYPSTNQADDGHLTLALTRAFMIPPYSFLIPT